MRSIPIRISVVLVVLTLLGITGVARAQEVQVNASLSPTQLYMGDSGILEVAITGATNAASMAPPVIPSVPGLHVEFAGMSSNSGTVIIINGQRRSQGQDRVVFQYRVTPTATGRFVIPAIPISVGTRTISTAPLAFTAAEPPEAKDVKLTLTLDQSTAYVGQPVTAILTLAFAADLQSVRFSTNTQATGIETFDAPNPNERTAERMVNIDLNGRTVNGALGRTTIDGEPWAALSLAYTVIPNEAGAIEIPGPIAVIEVITGQEGFGLLRQNIAERRIARAKPVPLTVKPLPTEGRPADFSGLIGRFDLSADATPTTVHVGEPITVRLSITGPEPLERAEPPDLGAIPGFADAFKLSPEGWAEIAPPSRTRSRVFTTTIRATSDTVSEIPAIPLSTFDPAKGAYLVSASKPIPLDVQETRQITAADAIGGAGSFTGGVQLPKVERVPLESAPSGVAFAPIPKRLTSQHLVLTEQFRSPLIAGALALPPVALAVSAVVAIRRRTADPEGSRRRGALRAAMRALSGSPNAEAAGNTIRIFLADRFGVARATVTAHDARRLLAPFSPELAEQAARALLSADASRFGSAPAPHPASASEIRALLSKLNEVTPS